MGHDQANKEQTQPSAGSVWTQAQRSWRTDRPKARHRHPQLSQVGRGLSWQPCHPSDGVQVQWSRSPLTQGLVHQLRAMREGGSAAAPLWEATPRHQQKRNSNSASLRTPELFPHLKNRGSLYLLSLQWELSEITFTKSLTRLCRYSINGGYY